MVRNPEAYRVIGRFALAVVGHTAFCDHCKNPVFDRAVYGRDPARCQRARRGWVVLTDTMYVVRDRTGSDRYADDVSNGAASGATTRMRTASLSLMRASSDAAAGTPNGQGKVR